MKKMNFLSGLPRSGSTLLGSILNKNVDVHVTPTSPLLDLIFVTEKNIRSFSNQFTFDVQESIISITRSNLSSFHENIDKLYIFNKHRAWTRNIPLTEKLLGYKFNGIMTYRPIPEIIVSYIKLMKKDLNNFIDNHLRNDGRLINTRNRADYLWRFYISDPYTSCIIGLEEKPENILPISYDDITSDTVGVLRKIGDFFDIDGLTDLNLNLNEIDNTCGEQKDEAWGLKDLHTIRPTIQKTSDDAMEVLGKELFEYYSQFNLKL